MKLSTQNDQLKNLKIIVVLKALNKSPVKKKITKRLTNKQVVSLVIHVVKLVLVNEIEVVRIGWVIVIVLGLLDIIGKIGNVRLGAHCLEVQVFK
jgi:hypothetical protein